VIRDRGRRAARGEQQAEALGQQLKQQ